MKKIITKSPNSTATAIAAATGVVTLTAQRAAQAKKATKQAKTRYKSAKKSLKRARKASRKAAKIARKARRQLKALQAQTAKLKKITPARKAKAKTNVRPSVKPTTLQASPDVPQPE